MHTLTTLRSTGIADLRILPSSLRNCQPVLTRSQRGWRPIDYSWITPRPRSCGVPRHGGSIRFRLTLSALAVPTCSLYLRFVTSESTLTPTCLWRPTSLPLSDRVSRLFVKSGVCVVLFHAMPCWLWFVPFCQQGWLLQLCPCWCFSPDTRPAVVRFEYRRPFGFLWEAVRTHRP